MEPLRLNCRFCDRECTLVAARDGGGRPVSLRPEHEAGVISCPTGLHALELARNPRRLTRPLLRTGARGAGKWLEITWDEAISLAARRLGEALDSHGPDSLLFISGFNKPLQGAAFTRIANVLGAPNRLGAGNMCHQAQAQAFVDTFGFPGERSITPKTRTVFLWGSNPSNTMRWVHSDIAAMRRVGGRLVVVDPLPTRMTQLADLWLPIRPGTDLALALGMMQVILSYGWEDRYFLNHHAEGLDEVRTAAAPYTLERTAQITGLPETDIERAAKWLARSKPGVIFGGNALDHNFDSYQKGRALCLLLALTGNVDVEGAAVPAPPSHPGNPVRNGSLSLQKRFTPELKARQLGRREPLLDTARQTSGQEMLRGIESGQLRGGWVMGADPVVMWADCHRTARVLGQLDFLLVQDFFLTPTAQMADLVLPVATYLEYENVFFRGDGGLTYRPAVLTDYDVKSDMEIIGRIGSALGYGQQFWHDMDDFWNQQLTGYGTTLAQLRETGGLPGTLPARAEPAGYRSTGFPTPTGKVRLSIPRLGEKGADAVPAYRDLPQPSEDWPYRCTNYKPSCYFHSAGRQIAEQRVQQPDPIAYVSPDTVRREGLSDGDWITVSTPVGQARQRCRVGMGMPEGTVALSIGWWYPEADTLEEALEPSCNNLASDAVLLGGEIQAFSVRGIPCRISRAPS